MKHTKVAQKRKKSTTVSKSLQIPIDYHWKILGALKQDLKGYLSKDDDYVVSALIRARDLSGYQVLGDFWGLQCINSKNPLDSFGRSKARYGIASLLKKYLPAPDESLNERALARFLETEKTCRFFNAFRIEDLLNGKDEFTVSLLTYARSFLKKLLGETVPVRDVIEFARHGPGANLDTFEGGISPYEKYRNLPYSCTGPAASYAAFMIQTDERWFRALKVYYRQVHRLSEDAPIDMDVFWSTVLKVVDHNRICYADKNAEISRTIAIEPTLNVMLQLGVDGVIRRRLKRWCIDLDSQDANRYLAKVGSLFDKLATLDLKAASDMTAIAASKALLPDEWHNFLMALRCPFGKLKGGIKIKYEKMSSMGNGYTFALESMIFAAIIYAVYKINNKELKFSANASVFGDDLIVDSSLYDDVVRGLKLCGYAVNLQKSFKNGPVRESCGTDWFKGRSLRPIHLTNPPTNIQELYVDYNRLKWYLETSFGITDSCVCETIMKWVPKGLDLRGPYSDEVFDSWIHHAEPPVQTMDGFSFKRILRLSRKKKFTAAHLFGDRWFFILAHNLLVKRPEPVYSRKRIRSSSGNRFDVESRDFTLRQKSSVVTTWPTVYLTRIISG